MNKENLGYADFEGLNSFEMTPDLVCLADKNGFFKKVNHAVVDKLGYTQQELFSRPIPWFIHSEDKDLTNQHLNSSLEWLCKEFSLLNGINCKFESAYLESDLAHKIRIDFFRVCQEALTNVMYHEGASKVSISIIDPGDKIILTITDDGKCFAMDEQKQTNGLTRMQERAASINGNLTLQSNVGEGTSACLTVPKYD
jgi:hypothetical protein